MSASPASAAHRALRLLLSALTTAAMALTTSPALASTAPPPEPATGDEASADWAPQPTGRRIELAAKSTGFWTWAAGKRGYSLRGLPGHGSGGYSTLDMYDLTSGVPTSSTKLVPGGGGHSGAASGFPYGVGGPHTIAVDDTGGRLFVAHVSSDEVVKLAAGDGHSCTPGGNTHNGTVFQCFGGFHVLDAATLEPMRPPVPYRFVRADTGGFKPILRAMTYAPPRPGIQENGKVLAVVEDWAAAGAPGVQSGQPRLKGGFNIQYAVQFDPTTGQQDWAVRLDACRGAREHESAQGQNTLPHPSAIFRSANLTDPAVYVACHNGSSQTAVVIKLGLDAAGNATFLPARVGGDPAGDAPAILESGDSPPTAPPTADYTPQSTSPRTAVGPTTVLRQIADPVRERFLMQSIFGNAEVWWVFDTARFAFTGTIGIGPVGSSRKSVSEDAALGADAAFDPVSGRLYVHGAPMKGAPAGTPRGLFITDTATEPLPQALVFPDGPRVEAVIAPQGDQPPLLLVDDESDGYAVYADRVPFGAAASDGTAAGGTGENPAAPALTLDLDEAEGVTQATFDGTARGYGARAVLVGGLEAAGRVDRFDPGWWYQLWMPTVREAGDGQFPNGISHPLTGQIVPPGRELKPEKTLYEPVLDGMLGMGPTHPCSQSNRELVLAFVGPEGDAVVDGSGSRGSAQPVRYDSGTEADSELPVSRCGFLEWSQYWNVGLFGRPPLDEPSLPTQGLRSDTAECISSDENPSSSVGDAVGLSRAAEADCSQEEASGFGYVRGATVAGNAVGEALSSFRIYRDPGRGIVSRVESVARGINIGGLVRIDTVRGTAESWANGRRQPVAAAERDAGYVPNCDMERTAGTCFQPHLFGVRTPAYSCGPCGDEARAVDGMSRALGSNGRVRLREPDPALSAGSEDGYQAAVLKPVSERFTDAAIHNDFLTTVLPTLEIIRYAPPASPGYSKEASVVPLPGPRGLQVYQFAGVAVSSSYGIQCLLVYDEAANTCAEPAEAPGSIQVSLSDTDGKPLAGGAFEVRADVDADGVLGLKDTLLPDGACVTADDGIGTCTFENLAPGTYLVSQVAAPPGYAKSAEPWVSEVASGEQRTVAFTNVSNVSTIDLTATDEHGTPLSGAVFAAYADPDSDGKVAPDAQPAAECTTDGQGVCTMKVPAGSYVLVQTAAPGGLEGIEPVPFTFASGGQVASVTVVNYPTAAPQAPEAAASPVYTPPVDQAPPREFIDDSYVAAPVADSPVIEEPAVSVPERIGGTVTQVIRAPGDALRLLARDPKQAVAWTAALALFVLAAMAVRRRQQAMGLIG